MTVILIDDEVFVCCALKTQLEILGCNMLVFQSADILLANDFPTGDTRGPAHLLFGLPED